MDAEKVTSREEFMRAYLAEHDEACPVCRYSLRGLEGACCPECGEALRLRVGVVEQTLAAWVGGLVGLAGVMGLLAIFLFFTAFDDVRHPQMFRASEYARLGVLFALQGGAFGWWLWKRRWIVRRGRGGRRELAIVAWGWSVSVFVGFVMWDAG